MFNLEKFYLDAHAGKCIDKREILNYIKSFEKVILWGAGNLGREIGYVLLSEGIHIFSYWDIDFRNKPICNGICVEEPFSESEEEGLLVIHCIVNGSRGEEWTKKELTERGYKHCLSGMTLYEGIVCPLHKEKIDITECTRRNACSLCVCERYANLMQEKLQDNSLLSFQLITFIVSTRCSLNCKYCGQRLAEYDRAEKIDYKLENIKRDIDNFSEAVDFVGMVSIIGGEPFLHPQIDEIVRHCLTKENIGIVNITTNGIVKLSEKLLNKIKNDRIKISFSYYETFLTEIQKELFERNVKLVEKSGISYSVAHPLWIKPKELKDYHYDQKDLQIKKEGCNSIKMCIAVKDGSLYPCSAAENIAGLHKYELKNSSVDVRDRSNLRKRIIDLLDQKYFDACCYCSSEKGEEIPAGEQVSTVS